MKREICQLCKKEIECPNYGDSTFDYSDVYDYRGFTFHEKCFDEGCEKVDGKRKEVAEVVDASVKSQAGGEWMNGGYKTMKVSQGGQPIVENPKTPKILEDYENGIL